MLKIFLKHSQNKTEISTIMIKSCMLISRAYQTLENFKDSYQYIPIEFLQRMKLLLNCSFQPQNTGLMGFLRCIPVYDQHSNVSQITILYGMIMQKEEILGFLVVIIAIPDCLYLSYICKSIYQ